MSGTEPPFRASAIILAAGSSSRMGRDKQFLKIGGKFIIEITVEAFLRTPGVTEIILALSPENLNSRSSLFKDKKIKTVSGGATRMESLRKSFAFSSSEVIAVHDGARPFASPELIFSCLAKALENGAAVPAVRLKDTVKEADETGTMFLRTIDRKRHLAVQTPQCYRREILEKMLAAPEAGTDLTDDSQLAEKLGFPVSVAAGDYGNLKITTEEDLIFAEAVYEKRFGKRKI